MFKKIILSIAAVIVLLIAFGVITLVIFKNAVDKSYPSNEVITRSKDSNSKEALIVYQNCKSQFPQEIASSIANGLNNKGYNVTINTAGDFLPKDVSKYNIVILGGATLAGNVGEPLLKYAENIKNYTNSKVILFSTGANKNDTTEINKLGSLLNKEPAKNIKFSYSDKEESKDKAVSLGEELGSN